jgi:ABC-type branched-subunit amino acid transport system ATPase component
MTSLEWDRVEAGYGSRAVLHDISIGIAPGELVAVLGTNGAGKSTLLKAAAGLVRCRRGAVRLGGTDVTRSPADRRARSGLALAAAPATTFAPLDVVTSVLLATPRQEYDRRMGAGDLVLSAFPELARRRRTRVSALSSGERQLLALAQALVRRPKVLLVDELSRALSRAALERALDAIRRAHSDGATVVIVDQSVDMALDLAPRACFLEAGRVRFDGPSEELRKRGDLLRPVFLARRG